MGDERLKSEAAELKGFIDELEAVREVKPIASLRSGFAALDAALNGIAPGVHLFVGPPGAGKTAFAKQLSDQAARLNSIAALFFAFGEKKSDLRVRTLARLSGLETLEIRRGAGYLLHTYGVAKAHVAEEEMAPGWEKLKAVAAEAKSWLERCYLIECGRNTTIEVIERDVSALRGTSGNQSVLVAIDDAQRLGDATMPLDERLPFVSEILSDLSLKLDLPFLATWPELGAAGAPERWAESAAGAAVVTVLRDHSEAGAIARRVSLHIVKNRGGEKATIEFDFTPGLAKFSERTS